MDSTRRREAASEPITRPDEQHSDYFALLVRACDRLVTRLAAQAARVEYQLTFVPS